MRQNSSSNGRLVLVGLMLLSILFSSALAFGAQPERPTTPNSADAPLDDGGTAEFGIEYITDWPGTADDRANWYHSANGLRNELNGAGWVQRFFWGNSLAWEEDFKAAANGGTEHAWIDTVDLGLMATHGSGAYDSFWNRDLSSVYYSTNNDNLHLSPGESYRALGDDDLEWLAWDSCSVLDDRSAAYWYTTFDGLHLMLGFANTMYVVYPGDGGAWGDQMQQKGWWIFGHGAKTVTQAWFTATDDQQPSGVRARVLAETVDNYNDYIWGQGYVSPDPIYDNYYWWWDHVAGTPPPAQLTADLERLPVIRVMPREVNEDYIRNIGQSFGLTSEILADPDGSAFYMVGGDEDEKQVRIDARTGAFYYQDLGELWTDPARARALPDTGEAAMSLAHQFLAAHDNLPGVFEWNSQIPPTVELEMVSEAPSPEIEGQHRPLLSNATQLSISYMRTVNVFGVDLSIVGPGSRQNVYVGDGGEVIGLKSGYVPLQIDQEREVVPILTAEEAWQAFLAAPTLAVAQPPTADLYSLTDTPPTLAYYQQPTTESQLELIPVWVFEADLYVQTEDERATTDLQIADDALIYVQAEETPDAQLVATIDAPAPGLTLLPGQTVDLAGSATGGTAPYTFEWSSEVNGTLGQGEALGDVSLTADTRSSSYGPNQITLTVTDANGLTATATLDIDVEVGNYLPTIRRD
jgi:hypothetical protein